MTRETSDDTRARRPGPDRRLVVALALASGVPALVYQVAWTREVALLVGGQVESIATVLVAFFAGLALGSRVLGARADRAAAPLVLYGRLEVMAGALALASPLVFDLAGAHLLGRWPPAALGLLVGVLMFAVTFLLGGTLPSLLRAAGATASTSARLAGWLLGLNTAGALGGVVLATALVPALGLRSTVWTAGGIALALGLVALAVGGGRRAGSRGATRSATRPRRSGPAGVPAPVLVAAGVAGVSTLAFEVLAARSCGLILGSSLYAWALVLALFLLGLAFGNAVAARAAAGSPHPATRLGIIEAVAALVLVAGVRWVVPDYDTPASGLSGPGPLLVAAWVLPATVLMGAAFPFFIRLGVRRDESIGAAFGTVSAVNTAGGIVGSLAAPFVLLPWLGLGGGLAACAAINAALALGCLVAGAPTLRSRLARPAIAAGAMAVAVAAGLALPRVVFGTPGGIALHVREGRQATAAVVRFGGRRDLIVDGEQEASTAGSARETEELLGILPLLRHPAPRRLLEVGLGSGISLGTAARFPLERLDCVEISPAVVSCAPFFAPTNGAVGTGDDPRLRIVTGDGRAFVLANPASYDVVVANTIHPWSLGATGLYSHEYFARLRRTLRPGGVVGQWLPLVRVGRKHLAAILRAFFTVFPSGEVWWGAENVIVIGFEATADARAEVDVGRALLGRRFSAAAPLLARLGIEDADDLWSRRLASGAEALAAIGPGPVLSDDRPALETSVLLRAGRGGPSGEGGAELRLVVDIAAAGARTSDTVEPARRWLAARVAETAGDVATARRLADEAEALGFRPAALARALRLTREGLAAYEAGDLEGADDLLRRALLIDGRQPHARYLLAVIADRRRDRPATRRQLERLVTDHPDHAEGWNLLSVLRHRSGDASGARAAVDAALAADPFFPEALANAGLMAVDARDLDRARALLARLEAIVPRSPQAATLRKALR